MGGARHGQVARWSRRRIHAVNEADGGSLKLIEIHREDIESLPDLMSSSARSPELRFIVFCDDLSFDAEDTSYKSLKAALDGGIEGRPDNMIFYATSNRRHLLPRDMIENERSTAINPSEAVQEKVSLSDRFGLWLGFHNCSQDDFLDMIDGYAGHYGLKVRRRAARRRHRMAGDARQPVGPRRLAIHPGSGRQAGSAAGLMPGGWGPWPPSPSGSSLPACVTGRQ